jgi:predicted transposase YbfD/YdcC
MLNLDGACVTTDAMHCQTETAKAVIQKDSDDLLMVKGNQPSLEEERHQAIIKAFDKDSVRIRRHHKIEINHCPKDYREVVVLPCPKDSPIFDR